jgi:ankyrin repeat protein
MLSIAIVLSVGCGPGSPRGENQTTFNENEAPNELPIAPHPAGPEDPIALESTQPLVESLLNRDEARFEELLDAGADPNAWDEMGRSAITVAAAIPNSQYWLTTVLNMGGNPHLKVPAAPPSSPFWFTGYTPLHCAVGVPDNMLNLRILVEVSKVDVNAKDAAGITPLGLATGNGQYEYADYLVEKGADPSDKAINGSTIREFVEFVASDDYPLKLTQEEQAGLSKLIKRLNSRIDKE